MSWDIFVQDLPADANSIAEIPRTFKPKGLERTRREIIESILKNAPFADISDPSWVRIDGHGVDIEVSLGDDEPVRSFAFHVRGSDASVGVIAAVLKDLGLRALDPQSETGLFDSESASQSLERWRAYRDEALGK